MVPGSSAPLHSRRMDTARVESAGWRRTMRATSLAKLTGVSSRSRNLPTVVGISWSTWSEVWAHTAVRAKKQSWRLCGEHQRRTRTRTQPPLPARRV